ncbi:formate dehydrogenase accessory sulfurtransferase FdhD [Microbacterium radiodurans]|uniref:Sulfur carrier protein FdhD n=1 Tax=Microbacterium radiodurans TaxID=661398 RepID=A0A5J5IUU2_9MICO|nr:formate dehydrogenase accessory sulfurtransferase FdhD [Microbacterium radiodurans]KAA9089678.1 formate dehydrogenase accessory sulfurtransferase FdhD [Microbacterium radiodurans]
MGRLTALSPVTRIIVDEAGVSASRRRPDTLAVEEPLEIRVGGTALSVTMRTPGHDVELAAGFLAGEGIIAAGADVRSAIHCGGPGTPGLSGTSGAVDVPTATPAAAASENTYNVLDVTLAPGVAPPAPEVARNFYTTSSCGVCGTASIEQVAKIARFDVSADAVRIDAAWLARLPDELRAGQQVFDKTGGLHAAALFDAATGELLVLREDVGRHNAVDKVVGWAVLADRLPASATVLQVSGRASFELVQKAAMAGIPVLAAVSAPSSLAVALAASAGITLVGFSRGRSLNVYAHPERIAV